MTVDTKSAKEFTVEELPAWILKRYLYYSLFRQKGLELEEIKYILVDMPISMGEDD